jgi:18S rRNA (guanine1575-N7)-methyltransferase
VLTCGPPSLSTAVPRGKGEDGESCSEDENSEENQMVGCFVLRFSFLFKR